MRSPKLPRSFYLRNDVLLVARDLIGKLLCTRMNGALSSGIIVETEAYCGEVDRASHAWNGRRTPRTEVMYARGGTAYVYLCYGVHHLFNVVTNKAGVPHAVLVRAIAPVDGIDVMRERRGGIRGSTSGPGTLSQALGIRTVHTGTDLVGDLIWIEDRATANASNSIICGPRIGVEYAGSDALLPYRFRLAGDLVHSRT